MRRKSLKLDQKENIMFQENPTVSSTLHNKKEFLNFKKDFHSKWLNNMAKSKNNMPLPEWQSKHKYHST